MSTFVQTLSKCFQTPKAMKKMKTIAACCLLAALLTACSSDKDEIETTAYGYLDAMGNYRPTEARPYATQETADVTLSFYEEMLTHTDPSVYANNIPAEITIGQITVQDSTATAAFHKSTPTVQQDGEIRLVKRNDRWLVHEVLDISGFPSMNAKPRKLSPEVIQALRDVKKDSIALNR